jgi:GNAT superfamily N-acetyltransferase
MGTRSSLKPLSAVEGVRIRVASSARDFDAFRALADEYEESLPQELHHEAWPSERLHAAAAYAAPHAVFLAEADGHDAGCVVLWDRQDAAVVKKLYVTPSARKSGAGRALMLALIDETRRRGYDRVLLDTHAEQLPAAYRLYCSLGFRERDAFDRVDYACATFMELTL